MIVSKTKKRFERYLNENYSPNIAECIHFTVKTSQRQKPISKKMLQIKLDQYQYGTLLKKYDPIAFEVAYKEWSKNE